MSDMGSNGFFCELKPITIANNIAPDLKLVNNFYFKVIGKNKFKVMGYNSNGLMKEGEAELIEDDEFDQDDIQGFFIENNKEIKFKIEPLRLFEENVFFGSGVWVEHGEANNPRQRYNIKIWDTSFLNHNSSFLSSLFEVNKNLKSQVQDFKENFKKQELELKNLNKSVNAAQENMQVYNDHSDVLAEALAESKSLLKDSTDIKKSLKNSIDDLEYLNADNAKLKSNYSLMLEQAEHLTELAYRNQDKAEQILGSAVTVQLAKSFKERKEAAAKKRDNYDKTFYFSLALGVAAALFIFYSSNNNQDGFWSYVQFFANRLPIVIIPLWLGVFASKKSSYLTRLEEFYAQKQTLAESYEGYKSRLNEIGDKASEDLIELMRINLISLSRDSQTVVDGASAENHSPIQELIALRRAKEGRKSKESVQETET